MLPTQSMTGPKVQFLLFFQPASQLPPHTKQEAPAGQTPGHTAPQLAKALQAPCTPWLGLQTQKAMLLSAEVFSQDPFFPSIRGEKYPQHSLVMRKCRTWESTLPFHLGRYHHVMVGSGPPRETCWYPA